MTCRDHFIRGYLQVIVHEWAGSSWNGPIANLTLVSQDRGQGRQGLGADADGSLVLVVLKGEQNSGCLSSLWGQVYRQET